MVVERSLSARTRQVLAELIGCLEARAGDDLAAIVAHGSIVRGEYRDGVSDLDLVIVLDRDDEALFEAIGPALAIARSSARIEAIILKRIEIPRAADVFPLLYGDIAREGVALRGDNPFKGIVINATHRRLRTEQELREARIRIRRAIGDVNAGLLSIDGLIERKLRQLRSALFAVLDMAGEAPDAPGLERVWSGAGRLLGVDVSPLLERPRASKAALRALVSLLDAAIARVDVEGAS